MVAPGRIFTFTNMCPTTPSPTKPPSLIRTGLLAVMTLALQSQTHFWGHGSPSQPQTRDFGPSLHNSAARFGGPAAPHSSAPSRGSPYQLSALPGEQGNGCSRSRSRANGGRARVFTPTSNPSNYTCCPDTMTDLSQLNLCPCQCIPEAHYTHARSHK